MKRQHMSFCVPGIVLLLMIVAFPAERLQAAVPLDPATLTKYLDEVPRPGVVQPSGRMHGLPYYEVTMSEAQQQLHSELPPTTIWGYNGSYPGPTIETVANQGLWVRWINNLPTQHLFGIDHSIHGAEEGVPDVRAVVHLHGGHTPSESDGGPEDWFTPGNSALYYYPNRQLPTTLWFHDHAMGITRLNVMAGLAAFYVIRDQSEQRLNLPSGNYEIPLVFQDRQFDTDGQFMYPELWEPEFFGDVALVNGKVWPRLTVEPRKYRFRLLDGSTSRFYFLQLLESDEQGNIGDNPVAGPAFYQIGSDGGFLEAPVVLNDPANPNSPHLLIGPGERMDVIVDFASYAGRNFLLKNLAKSPFKGIEDDGDDEAPLPEIMLVHVSSDPVSDLSSIPSRFTRIPRTPEASAVMTRDLALREVVDENDNPLYMTLNGHMYDDPVTETPRLGTAEIWRIINTTGDVHPMHLHLVEFQILDRQPFDLDQYMENGELVFTGPRTAPAPNEMGWKDTFLCPPGQVSRMIARFTDYTGRYVWHCHILEHEENEMMRPFEVVAGHGPRTTSVPGNGEITAVPMATALSQNYPNPFNPQTSISFSLRDAGTVKLSIFNTLGQHVSTLVEGSLEAGTHRVSFDGADLPSGVYFYRLETNGFVDQKKMLLLK